MVRESHLDFEVRNTKLNYRQNCDRTAQRQQQTWKSDNTVRCGSHWSGSLQNGLRDK